MATAVTFYCPLETSSIIVCATCMILFFRLRIVLWNWWRCSRVAASVAAHWARVRWWCQGGLWWSVSLLWSHMPHFEGVLVWGLTPLISHKLVLPSAFLHGRSDCEPQNQAASRVPVMFSAQWSIFYSFVWPLLARRQGNVLLLIILQHLNLLCHALSWVGRPLWCSEHRANQLSARQQGRLTRERKREIKKKKREREKKWGSERGSRGEALAHQRYIIREPTMQNTDMHMPIKTESLMLKQPTVAHTVHAHTCMCCNACEDTFWHHAFTRPSCSHIDSCTSSHADVG